MNLISRVLFISILGFFFLSCSKPNIDGSSVLKNIAYGNHERQKMDVYLPANRNANDTRLLVWIHGGAWTSGDKNEFVNIKPYLDTSLLNYAFISLNYRLFNSNTGTNKFPTQEEDIAEALAFISSKLTEWRISNKVVIAGASAGGHLALLHAFKNNQSGLIKACIAYFPPTELVSMYPANLISILTLNGVLNGAPNDQPEAYFASSPVNFISDESVPTIFFHGTSDDVVPISQSELLRDKLSTFNVLHDYLFFDGEGHSFSLENTKTTINRFKTFLEEIGL